MVAKSPIQDVVAKWNTRAQQYKAAGGNLADLTNVAQTDINNVHRGHSPMADEAAVAAMSGALGKPIIPDAPTGVKIKDIPGNFLTDAFGMLSGMTVGLAKTAVESGQDIAHGKIPRLIQAGIDPLHHNSNSPEDKQWQAEHGFEDLSGKKGLSRLAAETRNLAHDTISGMLPGVSTAANLTTHKGRQEIERHPFNTLVDVLPLAKGVGEAAYLGKAGELSKLARAEVEGGDISKVYLEAAKQLSENGGKIMDLTPDIGSHINVYDSLLGKRINPNTNEFEYHGFHPFRGILEGVPAARRLTAAVSDATQMFSHDIRETIFRPKNEAERIAFETETARLHAAVPQLREMSKEDRHKLADVVTEAHFDVNNPETYQGFDRATVEAVKKYSDTLTEMRVKQGLSTRLEVNIGGKTVPLEFIKNGPTHKAFLEATRLENVITNTSKEIGDLTQQIATAVDDRTKSRLTAQRDKLMDNAAVAQNDLKLAQVKLHQKMLHDVPISHLDAVQKNLLENGDKLGEDFMMHKIIKVEDLPTFEKYLSENKSLKEYKDILTDYGKSEEGIKYFNEHMDDVRGFWKELVAQGAAPVYLAHVSADPDQSLRRAATLSFANKSESSLIRDHLSGKPSHTDALFGLTQAGVEIYAKQASTIWVRGIMDTLTQSNETAIEYAKKQLDNTRAGQRMKVQNPAHYDQIIQEAIHRQMRPIREGTGIVSWDDFKPGDRLVTKATADAMSAITREKSRLPVMTAIDRATGLYKWEVMLGPRHLAHIAFGGLMMILMRDPGSLTQVLEYAKNYRSIREMLPQLFAKSATFGEGELEGLKVGGTLARFTQKALGENAASKLSRGWKEVAGEDSALNRFEEHLLQMQRAMVALNVAHGAENLLKPENVLVREQALQEVYKTLVDTENMAPWERNVLREVLPFYAFTKHIVKFTFSYPNDHPIAAAVLNNLVRQTQQDFATGLPQTFQFLFTLGHKDSKGEQTTIDFRAFDPFRSAPDLPVLQGFVSGLNPTVQAIMEASGVNPLTASPDLYPELTVDSQTGAIIAKRDNVAWKLTKDYIPGFNIIDHYLPLLNRTKQIKQGNKAAFDKAGYQAFNMPIAIVHRSLAADRARYERNKLKVLQSKMAKATQTGNFKEVAEYPLVPYQGTFVNPKIVEAKYKAAAETLKRAGISAQSIKAYLPKTSAAKRKLTIAQLEAMLAAQQGG